MSASVLLGIDVGTSSTKCILVDSSGKILGQGSEDYPISNPNPGWIEQDPKDWIKGMRNSIQNAIQNSPCTWSDVVGLSITHQRMTLIAVDDEYDPLYPAVLWNDTRSTEEVEWANSRLGKKKIFQKTGYSPGLWSVYKILWMKNKEPDIYKRTKKFLLV